MAVNLLNMKVIMLTVGIISVRLEPEEPAVGWVSVALEYTIAVSFHHVFGVYTVRIFLKMPHKTDMPVQNTEQAGHCPGTTVKFPGISRLS